MGNPTCIAEDVQIKQLAWFEHVNKMTDVRLPRIAMLFLPDGKKKKKRKRKTQKNMAE